jgi:hypothetical protein
MGGVGSHRCATVELNHADTQTDIQDQAIRCSSLTLGREEHLKTICQTLHSKQYDEKILNAVCEKSNCCSKDNMTDNNIGRKKLVTFTYRVE